jgi:hypothetical protein
MLEGSRLNKQKSLIYVDDSLSKDLSKNLEPLNFEP